MSVKFQNNQQAPLPQPLAKEAAGPSIASQVKSAEVTTAPTQTTASSDGPVQAQYAGGGQAIAQDGGHSAANFAASGSQGGGTNVLNLQIVEGTQQEVQMTSIREVAAPQIGNVEDVAAINRAKAAEELRNVPTVADLESIKSGDLKPADVAAALKTALLSKNPQVVNKAARTLQVAESYGRKAEQDQQNYAGTGFKPFHFPKLQINFNADETTEMMKRVAQTGNAQTADVMLMAADKGLVKTTPDSVFRSHHGVQGLASGESAQLAGSDGREAPRGAATFQEEWKTQVEPGLTNIKEAIAGTAKVKGAGCPYSQGNHAKGVSFENAEMKIDAQAPDWAKDLIGPSLKGGMVRISGSQTDPDQPDQESHMPGIRIAFPVNGALDGSATQTIDITANTGSTTHAQTAAEHTQFTKDISVPKKGFFGWKPVRAAKYALGALLGPGKVMERVGAMRNAVEVTDMAMGQKFHEHKFHGRHAFFVGGRYVQVRFEVVEPNSFPDPNKSNDPNARLNAVEQTVGQHGMKLAMYMTEMPDGNPNMVEQEGWEGLPEVRLATIDVPAQQASNHSKASQWFTNVPHVPGGPDKIFHSAGLGRHRVPVYEASGKFRNDHNATLATRN